MILESSDLPSAEPVRASVCVVGTGAAGIAVALELEKAGVSVLLLEAGGEQKEDSVHDAYKGKILNANHPPAEDYRERRLGGTTTLWSGRCVPFDPIDFEERPWMEMSGWPISGDDLLPFYPHANELVEAGEFDYCADTAFDHPLKPMIAGFESKVFTTNTMERFSCPTNFGWRYRARLAASTLIRLVLHAAVTKIELGQDGTVVSGLDVRTPSGERLAVDADEYVLAMGGLEAPRLMLASNDVHSKGIANESGVLGRYYMAHLAGTAGRFRPRGGTKSVYNNYDISDDGVYTRRRIAMRPEVQRERGIGNCVARLHHTRINDPSHGSGVLSTFRLGRAAVPQKFVSRIEDEKMSVTDVLHHSMNVIREIPSVVGFARNMVFHRILADRKFPSVVVKPRGGYSLDFHSEQSPNWNSQVRLGTERDALGMPRLEVDWRYSDMDLKTVGTFLELFGTEVHRSGVGIFAFDSAQVELEMVRYGAYPGHQLGTTRMSADPRHGVVDSECRVHGVANLHIAGAAVFATSSQANPTLTMLALALRLAERLRVKTTAPALEMSL
jgi:choline dehydrogenase-like flavoprotein